MTGKEKVFTADEAMEYAQQRIVKSDDRLDVIDGLVVVGGLHREYATAIYDITIDHPVTKAIVAAQPKAPLTLDDLDAAIADERHLGWGYATREGLSSTQRERCDKAVVAVANELGLSKDDLFQWTNSKYGRWLTDSVAGCGRNSCKRLVREYLNAEAVAVATENGNLS